MAADEQREPLLADDLPGGDDASLSQAMNEVPMGALALASAAVLLLMIGWFLIYLLIFLPRGSVG
jgi:hypothetical protein